MKKTLNFFKRSTIVQKMKRMVKSPFKAFMVLAAGAIISNCTPSMKTVNLKHENIPLCSFISKGFSCQKFNDMKVTYVFPSGKSRTIQTGSKFAGGTVIANQVKVKGRRGIFVEIIIKRNSQPPIIKYVQCAPCIN